MPGNIFAADTSFPQFYGNQSADEKIGVVTDYLFMLLEELRYTLANLGQENFNDTELGNIAKIITDPVYLRLESITGEMASISATAEGLETSFSDLKGNVSTLTQTAENLSLKMENLEGNVTSLSATAEGLTAQVSGIDGRVTSLAAYIGGLKLSVTNGAESSTITLSAKEATLSSQEIKITGMVTFASLSGSGTSIINGDNITMGKISGIEYEMVIDPSNGYAIKGGLTAVVDLGLGYAYFAGMRVQFYDTPTVGSSRARLIIEAYPLLGEPGGIEINAPEVHINGNLYINRQHISAPT